MSTHYGPGSIHEAEHVQAGADDIDAPLDARAIALANQGEIVFRAAAANTLASLAVGVAGQALLTGGAAADPSWGAPAPAAHESTHVLGGADDIDSGLDARALNLANQGEIVFHAAAANTLVALAVGAAGQALLSGGAGADVSWGAPAPAAHESTHVAGGADDIDSALDARALGLTAQGEIVFHAAAANTLATLAVGAAGDALLSGGAGADVSWGAPAPAAHRTTHEPEGADEVRGIDLPSAPGADETGWGLEVTATAGEIVEAGEICYRNADGKYWLSDANLVAAMPAVVMAMEDLAADASGRFLHIGYYRQDAWNWTPASGEDGLLYASATPGAMTVTQPAVANDLVQVVAYIIDDDHVFFNPSYELVEIAA